MSDDGLDLVFRALADPTRRRILDSLRERPRTVGELDALVTGMTRFGVRKHLGVLEEAGLVVTEKEGRKRWKHLNAMPLRRMYERWVSPYADMWATNLESLARHVERDTNGH
ncbi:MAG: ArsR/SmtB family transcription factor [Planctomycetota bacterium]|jgi:DNA-binding transcriptional ArsR family regulator